MRVESIHGTSGTARIVITAVGRRAQDRVPPPMAVFNHSAQEDYAVGIGVRGIRGGQGQRAIPRPRPGFFLVAGAAAPQDDPGQAYVDG